MKKQPGEMLSAHCGPRQLLVVLVGVPGSGKSTFAHALCNIPSSCQPRWCRVSQDVLGSRGRCIAAAEQALRSGEHVIVDRCNFDAVQRSHWLGLRVSPPPTHRIAVYLPVPLGEARRRVLARPRHEGGVDAVSMSKAKIGQIVARMHRSLSPPQADEGFDEVLRIGDAPGEREVVLQRVWSIAGEHGVGNGDEV